jgi:hypothetical protein
MIPISSMAAAALRAGIAWMKTEKSFSIVEKFF